MAAKKKGKVKSRPKTVGNKNGNKKVTVKAGTSKASAEQRRALFIDAYIANGENGTQAAVTAGYKPGRAAEKAAQRMSQDVVVQAALEERRAALREKSGLTVERVLRELARITFFDPRKLFDAKGNPIDLTALDDDTAAAVQGLEVLEEFEGSGKDKVFVGYVKKYRIAGKVEAISHAMKHLGLFEKDNKQQTDPIRELLAAVNGVGKLEPRP